MRLANKAQQTLLLNRGSFSNSLAEVGTQTEEQKTKIPTETNSYKYSTRATKQAAFNYAISKQPKIKSYVGGVFIVPDRKLTPKSAAEKILLPSILCEADVPGTIQPAEPTYENGTIACGQGTTEVTK